MRTELEIREKIEEYMDRAKHLPWTAEEAKEYMLTIVDALLWVIGDESGKPI